MTAETTTTDLVVDQALKGTIAKASSLKDIAAALDVHVPAAPVYTNVAAWPTPLELTPEQREALNMVPRFFGQVHPAEPKILDDDEMTALFGERQVLREVLEPLVGRDEVIKEIVRHHMDLVAEQSNVAIPKDIVRGGSLVAEASPRDKAGHYILASKGNPERAHIPGTNQDWSREYREGGISFANAASDLLAMYEAGDITREQYLTMTREVRAFDEPKTMEAVRKDPETYLPILRAIAHRADNGTSMFVRKTK